MWCDWSLSGQRSRQRDTSKTALVSSIIMNCSQCPRWQGGKYSEYGDCYRVMLKLSPNLDGCYQESEDRPDSEVYFTVPFDPHDVKEYWTNHPFLRRLLKIAYDKANSTDGMRTEILNGCTYIQTRRDYSCHDK